MGISDGNFGAEYTNVGTLSAPQTSATQPWIVTANTVITTGGTECVDFGFDKYAPPGTIAQFAIFLLEYSAPGTDNSSIAGTWNSSVSGNAITNETITRAAEPIVSFGLANGSTILAGNGAASRLSILDSTGILLQDESVGQGNAAPQMFVNSVPNASFFLSIGLEPTR
jgi:hypothetical protein